MTPLQIQMMLHYYCSPTPFERQDAPAAIQALELFRDQDLIKEVTDDGVVRLSSRGLAYVAFLTSLPLPAAGWGIPGSWSPNFPDSDFAEGGR